MNSIRKAIVLVATVALAATGASADNNKNYSNTVTSNADKMFQKCDENSDGMVSKQEYTNKKMKAFEMYDKDSNGSLSKAEHQMMVVDMHDMAMGTKAIN